MNRYRSLIPALLVSATLLTSTSCKIGVKTSDEETTDSSSSSTTSATLVLENLKYYFDTTLADQSGPYATGCTDTLWKELVTPGVMDTTLTNFSGCATSGWQGSSDTTDPYRLVFDASSAPYDYAVSAGNSAMTGNTDFTVLAWVKIPTGMSTNGASINPLVAWGTSGANNNALFGVRNGSLSEWYVGWEGSGQYVNTTIVTDSWLHIAWIRDSSSSVNDSHTGNRLYVNGLVTAFAGNDGGASTPAIGSGPLHLGGSTIPTTAGYGSYETAQITIYDRALAATEVRQNCEFSMGRFDGSSCGTNTAPVTVDIAQAGQNEDGAPFNITITKGVEYTDTEDDYAMSCTASITSGSGPTIGACSCTLGTCSAQVTLDGIFNGNLTVEYTVSDNLVSNTSTITVPIAAQNDLPTNSLTAAAAIEDTEQSITLTYADVDNEDAVSCSVSSLTNVTNPTACSCTSGVCTVGILACSNCNDSVGGPFTFDYQVNDGTGNSTASTVTLAVTAANDAPTISDVTNQTCNLSGSLNLPNVYTIDEGGGSDEDAQTLSVSVASSDSGVLPASNVDVNFADASDGGASGDASTRTIDIDCSTGTSAGTTTITLTVTDSLGLTATDTFDLTISSGPVSVLTASPSPVNFGTHLPGSDAVEFVTITNNTTGTATAVSASVTGTDYSKTTDGCTGTTLYPSSSCKVGVRFTPATTASNFSGTLSVGYNDGSSAQTLNTTLSASSLYTVTTNGLFIDVFADLADSGSAAPASGCALTQWYDLSGALRHGTLTGFAGCGAGRGWEGTGTSGDPYRLSNNNSAAYVDFGNLGAAPTNFTAEVWMKRGTVTDAWDSIFSMASTDEDTFFLYNSGQIAFGDGLTGTFTALPAVYTDQTKYHQVVIVVDSSTSTDTAHLYLDGAYVNPFPVVGISRPANWDSVKLGTRNAEYMNNASINRWRVYSRSLNGSEVYQNCLTMQQTLDSTCNVADPNNSSISGTGPVSADGVSTSTITITLLDGGSNAVVGVVPEFTATDTSSGNHYGVCSETNGSGVSTCTLSSMYAESKDLWITSPISKKSASAVVFNSSLSLHLAASLGNLTGLPDNPTSTWEDLTTNNNDGTISGNASGWAGIGTAASPHHFALDGSTSIDLGTAHSGAGTVMFSAWISPGNATETGTVILGNGGGSGNGFELRQSTMYPGKLEFGVGNFSVNSYEYEVKNTSNLLAYWRMSVDSNGTIEDLSGNAHHGAITNNPTHHVAGGLAGDPNGALEINRGGRNSWVDAGDLGVGLPAAYAIEMWAKRGTVSGSWDTVFNLGTATSQLLFIYENGTMACCNYDGPFGSWAGVWTDKTDFHHIVFNVASSGSGANVELYFDNVSQGSVAGGGTQSFDTIMLGGDNVYAWDGVLDEFAIYDRVLTAGEINTRYNARNATGCLSKTTLQNNQWYQVTGIYDGTDTSLYINGELECTVNGVQTLTPPATNLVIGGLDGGGSEWTGKIADLSLGTSVASPALREAFLSEIDTYRSTSPEDYGSPADFNFDPAYIQNGMGPYAGTCATQPGYLNEISSNGMYGYLSGFEGGCGGTTGWQGDGTAGDPYRLTFQRSENSLVSFEETSLITPLNPGSGAFAIEAWIRTSYTTADHCYFNLGAPGGDSPRLSACIDTSGNSMLWLNGGQVFSGRSVADGNWHHVVVTRNGSDNNIYIYIDGEYVYTTSSATDFSTATNNITLGDMGQNWTYGYQGDLSVTRFYKRYLSGAEVAEKCEALTARFSGHSCNH